MPIALRWAAEVALSLRELHRQGKAHGGVDAGAIHLGPSGAILAPSSGHSPEAAIPEDVSAFGTLLNQMVTGAGPKAAMSSESQPLDPASDPGKLRASALHLAALCLAGPADMRRVALELRLLSLLAARVDSATPLAPPPAPATPSDQAPKGAQPWPTPSHVRCPRCGQPYVHSSRPRNIFESVIKRLGFRPYRCHRCWRRHCRFLGLPITLRE